MKNLRNVIDQFPRVKLAYLPTPLEEMKQLSNYLRGPRLWIKRDDLTGLVFGGNKVRKLEFVMADALEKGANTIVAGGMIQSNHAFATLAAARKLGMKAVLLFRERKPQEYRGNLLLDHIFGADIRFFKADWRTMADINKKIIKTLIAEGYVPYYVPSSSPLGSIGYVNAMLELVEQADSLGIEINYIVHAAGSGGTQAGLVVGNKILKRSVKVIGVSVEPDSKWLHTNTLQIANGCIKLLKRNSIIRSQDIIIINDYVERGYKALTSQTATTIKVVAEKEGILLDPIYTGKAMKGLIDLVKSRYFKKQDNIVFVHTGGTPAIFAYGTILQK